MDLKQFTSQVPELNGIYINNSQKYVRLMA